MECFNTKKSGILSRQSIPDLELCVKRIANNTRLYKWIKVATIDGYQFTIPEIQQEIRERKLKQLGI